MAIILRATPKLPGNSFQGTLYVAQDMANRGFYKWTLDKEKALPLTEKDTNSLGWKAHQFPSCPIPETTNPMWVFEFTEVDVLARQQLIDFQPT